MTVERKTRGGFVDYVVKMHVDVGDGQAFANASMECPSGTFKGEGRAKFGQTESKQHIAGDLATARALRAIESELMEHVHEKIDRCTDSP
jgi:hypothetical protein